MTLVMFVHPRCSCSRASLRELAYIMARARHNLTAHIFFYQPAHRPDTWIETDLWHYARTIPFTTVHRDPDGKLAERFGALASGQVVLFRPDGRRVFYGASQPAAVTKAPTPAATRCSTWCARRRHHRPHGRLGLSDSGEGSNQTGIALCGEPCFKATAS